MLLLANSYTTLAENNVDIAIEAPIYQHYLGKSDDGDNKNQRELTEIRLLLRALLLGGYNGQVKFIPLNEADFQGVKLFLSEGRATISATAWGNGLSSAGKRLYYSSALVRHYDVGIYTTRHKSNNLKINHLKDFGQLSAAVQENWVKDIALLQTLNLKAIYPVKSWRNMLRLVESGRADFLVAAFSGAKDLSREHQGLTLYPVPGVKLRYPGARHWVISLAHPRGKYIHGVIQAGIKQLKASGELQQAYSKAGVFNQQVTDWKRLN